MGPIFGSIVGSIEGSVVGSVERSVVGSIVDSAIDIVVRSALGSTVDSSVGCNADCVRDPTLHSRLGSTAGNSKTRSVVFSDEVPIERFVSGVFFTTSFVGLDMALADFLRFQCE